MIEKMSNGSHLDAIPYIDLSYKEEKLFSVGYLVRGKCHWPLTIPFVFVIILMFCDCHLSGFK